MTHLRLLHCFPNNKIHCKQHSITSCKSCLAQSTVTLSPKSYSKPTGVTHSMTCVGSELVGASATHVLPAWCCISHVAMSCAQLSAIGSERAWVCRGQAGGDFDTRQRGAARAGVPNIAWRPALLQVPSPPLPAPPPYAHMLQVAHSLCHLHLAVLVLPPLSHAASGSIVGLPAATGKDKQRCRSAATDLVHQEAVHGSFGSLYFATLAWPHGPAACRRSQSLAATYSSVMHQCSGVMLEQLDMLNLSSIQHKPASLAAALCTVPAGLCAWALPSCCLPRLLMRGAPPGCSSRSSPRTTQKQPS